MAVVFGATTNSWIDRTTNLPSTSAFTFMCWIFPTSLPATDKEIAALGNLGTFSDYELFVSSSTLSLWNGSTQVNGSTLSANVWRHVACTVNGTTGSNALGYLDGVLNITQTARAVGTGNMRYGNNGGSEPFLGRIAAIKVYSAVLTAAEIAQERWSVMPIRTANLNDWRPFWGTSDVVDYSGNGNASTSSGTLSSADGPPIPWRGRRRRVVYIPGGGGTTLTPSAAISTWTAPSPVLSAGPVTLTPSAAVSTWVGGTPTLVVGPLTLSPTAPASTWPAPAPSLTPGSVTLSPAAASSSWTVPAPSMSEGGVTLSPTAPSSTWTVPTPVLSVGPLSLAPTAPFSTWHAGNATLSGGSNLTPSAGVSTWHAGAATLSIGPLTLTPSAATSAWTANTPVLGVGSLTLSPNAPHASWTAPAAVLGAGPLTLAPIAATTVWHAGATALGVGAVVLAAAAAVARWFAGSAVLVPATHHLDEPLSIDFDSLASAIDFASLETALDFDDLTTAIDFTQLTTAIDFDSLETVLVFLDGGTEVFELTIIKGEVTAIAMTLRGADPVTGNLVAYDMTAATSVKLNAGKPGATLIVNAKDLVKTDAANGRVTYNPDPAETAVGGRYEALVVATFPGSPNLVRKFPGKLTIKDAIA